MFNYFYITGKWDILLYITKTDWGGGSKIIEKTANAIKAKYPDKKGYSPRNLTYMCQFAKQYPIKVLKRLAAADMEMECPTVEKVVAVVRLLNEFEFTQEPLAQIQSGYQSDIFSFSSSKTLSQREILAFR